MTHIPVLLKEVLRFLDPHPGDFIIDGTLGGGGHARAILERLRTKTSGSTSRRLGEGMLLAVDGDAETLTVTAQAIRTEIAESESRARFIAEVGNFADVPAFVAKYSLPKADGLVLDLGFSSEQLGGGRGLSFLADEPLDMRYGAFAGDRSAEDIVNRASADEIADILATFGEERYARRIADAIVWKRKTKPFRTTTDLIQTIMRAVPHGYERGRIHPATRTFQALRIVVNRELDNLEAILSLLPTLMARGGRVVVISFHSLEDRIVKNIFKSFVQGGSAALLTKKLVTPGLAERRANPRSRSAKLRAIKFINLKL